MTSNLSSSPDPAPSTTAARCDAIALVSFGGPNGPDDVMPFLRNVTRGRGVPDERLELVAKHYYARGGVSPINEKTQQLAEALQAAAGVPVYIGNRNWEPYLADTMRTIAADGHRRVVAITTSAYSSYSGCRQYRENLRTAMVELAPVDQPNDQADATTGMAAAGLEVTYAGPYWDLPGFLTAQADAVLTALAELPASDDVIALLGVTHSIPTAMANTSGPDGHAYEQQHRAVLAHISDAASAAGRPVAAELVFCSRSGPPSQPWLEPDVNDRLEQLAAAGVSRVVLVPIGFTSDHMEVVQDLDTEAMETARRVGLHAVRADTVGTHPSFVTGLAELIHHTAAGRRLRTCTNTCCPALKRPVPPARPAGAAERPTDA